MRPPSVIPPNPSATDAGARPRPADTRARILNAALELFAERGFASATTSHIARRAGVAEKTIFAHFKSKELLFDQTLTPATIDLLIPEVLRPLRDFSSATWDHLDELLRVLIQNRFRLVQNHPAKFKLILQELLLRPERARKVIAQRGEDPITTRLEQGLRRLRRRGELRDVPLSLVFRLYVYVLLGYAAHRLLFSPDQEWDDEREIRDMVTALVDGLRPRGDRQSRAPQATRRAKARSRPKRR